MSPSYATKRRHDRQCALIRDLVQREASTALAEYLATLDVNTMSGVHSAVRNNRREIARAVGERFDDPIVRLRLRQITRRA